MDNIIAFIKKVWSGLYSSLPFILLIICLTPIVYFFLISPVIRWFIEDSWESELRVYIRFGLLLFIVNSFAILRLYNSIVANTRFLIKVREALLRINKSLPSFERKIQSLINSISALNTRLRDAKKEK